MDIPLYHRLHMVFGRGENSSTVTLIAIPDFGTRLDNPR